MRFDDYGASHLDLVVFYSFGKGEIRKGWHIGWRTGNFDCSKYGPFITEESAEKCLQNILNRKKEIENGRNRTT